MKSDVDTAKIKQLIIKLPFYIMTIFAMVHVGNFIKFNFAGKIITLAPLNTAISLLYLAAVYLWALWVNEKKPIKAVALLVGALSAICIVISLPDFGPSVNDALFTGSAILSLLYVFENAEYLLQQIKTNYKYLTGVIVGFVILSFVLFIFFPELKTEWGEGIYFFGHRYASVCNLAIILISLKMMNRSNKAGLYAFLMLFIFAVCFWTGARVYIPCNLGLLFGVAFAFRKNNIDFLIKCVLLTCFAALIFVISPMSQKNEDSMVQIISVVENNNATAELDNQQAYELVNELSNGRLNMWKNCLKSYQELPFTNKLLGSGNKYIYDNNWNLSSHTDFLNILHFHGAIGVLLYLAVFVGYVAFFWYKNKLPVILLIGFWGVWLCMALLNGYASYTANMMSLPYIVVLSSWVKSRSSQKVVC